MSVLRFLLLPVTGILRNNVTAQIGDLWEALWRLLCFRAYYMTKEPGPVDIDGDNR